MCRKTGRALGSRHSSIGISPSRGIAVTRISQLLACNAVELTPCRIKRILAWRARLDNFRPSNAGVGLVSALSRATPDMLKITQSNTSTEDRWTLCGQLTGPWVGQLRSDWERTQTASGNRKCVVDLRDVTFIDERGAELLRDMRNGGAEFMASGVDTKHLVENLNTRERRPLRKFLVHLEHGCGRSRKGKQQGE